MSRGTAWLGVGAVALSCATAHKPATPKASRATQCNPAPQHLECTAFRKSSFVEAYVVFVHATPNELEIGFPLSQPIEEPIPVSRAERPDFQRSYAMRETLAELKCFSVTEQELDALADAVGIHRPPPDPKSYDPEKVRTAVEHLSGRSMPELRELTPAAKPEPYLAPVRHIPEACTTIYEVPAPLIAALRAEKDPDRLGEKWASAVHATGPNLAAFPLEEGAADARIDVREWQALARDLLGFVRLGCGGRKLYVEIGFDC